VLATLFSSVASSVATAEKALNASPHYAAHNDLSYYLRDDGSRAKIRTVSDWKRRRQHILAGIQEAMGPLPSPESPTPLDVQVLEVHRAEGLIRRKLAYHTDSPERRVKAWLLLPVAGLSEAGRRPAVLCLHQTTPHGKDSPVGLSDRPSMHYALTLARHGYVTLSPDYPSLGEYPYDFDDDDYESGSMKAIYDNIRAIDLLQSLPEVDPARIGCIGHSLGGHNALFTAVFDTRIKVVVTSCGFTSFHKYFGGDLHGWSGPRYMPRVATRYNFSPDKMPFDFPEILASIAPRTVFIVAPRNDDNFDFRGVDECFDAANDIYQLVGHPGRIRIWTSNDGHDFPAPARALAFEIIDRVLDRVP
jgi:acetyl esterase/lipase